MSFIQQVIRLAAYFFTPGFWRALLKGQTRVAVYLSGGQTVKFNCISWSANLDKGTKQYEFSGLTDTAGFDVTEIIGAKEVSWW